MRTRNAPGFTLVELLIVVTIVAILSAIAIPSYRAYVIRVKRADAKVALTSAAQAAERCYTRLNTYVGCDTGYPRNTDDATYSITFNPAPTRSAFLVVATPLGGQLDDTQCATFTLDQTGTQRVTGTKSATPADCW